MTWLCPHSKVFSTARNEQAISRLLVPTQIPQQAILTLTNGALVHNVWEWSTLCLLTIALRNCAKPWSFQVSPRPSWHAVVTGGRNLPPRHTTLVCHTQPGIKEDEAFCETGGWFVVRGDMPGVLWGELHVRVRKWTTTRRSEPPRWMITETQR